MDNIFSHDPEAAHKIRDGHYGFVEPYRERAKIDPDLVRQLEDQLGNAAYAFTECAKHKFLLPMSQVGPL